MINFAPRVLQSTFNLTILCDLITKRYLNDIDDMPFSFMLVIIDEKSIDSLTL